MVLVIAVFTVSFFASCKGGDEPESEVETVRTESEVTKVEEEEGQTGEVIMERAVVEERMDTGGEEITAGGFRTRGDRTSTPSSRASVPTRRGSAISTC